MSHDRPCNFTLRPSHQLIMYHYYSSGERFKPSRVLMLHTSDFSHVSLSLSLCVCLRLVCQGRNVRRGVNSAVSDHEVVNPAGNSDEYLSEGRKFCFAEMRTNQHFGILISLLSKLSGNNNKSYYPFVSNYR